MDPELSSLRALGARVASVLDRDAATGDARARARSGFLAGPVGRRISRGKAAGVGLGLAACAAVVALVGSRLSSRADGQMLPLTIEAVSDDATWVAAPADRTVPLRFSDGSEVTLARSGRARIVARTRSGATVAVERGELLAHIQHRVDTSWRFEAGPYDVRVTGTKFFLSWDPMDAALVVRLEEGSVVVTGCDLQELRVGTGEELRSRCNRDVIPPPAPVVAASSVVAVELPAPVPSSSLSAPVWKATLAAASEPGVPADTSAPAPSWRALAAAGRYSEAFAVAEAEGLDAIGDVAVAEDLLALSNAARFSGHGDAAVRMLGTIRRRFASTPSAAVAAFLLGRIAFDQHRAFAEAATWFETAAREDPTGPLAREAAGRLIEAADRAGDGPRARATASAYVKQYPTGPHSELARRLAGH